MDEHDDQYEIARKRVEARIGFFVHLAVYVVINVIFLIVVGRDFLWATVFWGLGLAVHAGQVFFPGSNKFQTWKARAIDREVARQQGETPADPDATAPQ